MGDDRVMLPLGPCAGIFFQQALKCNVLILFLFHHNVYFQYSLRSNDECRCMFFRPHAPWVRLVLCKFFFRFVPLGNFTHWLLQGIPATTVNLAGYLALGDQPIILPLYVSIQFALYRVPHMYYDSVSLDRS
jgi:hypothetical protein